MGNSKKRRTKKLDPFEFLVKRLKILKFERNSELLSQLEQVGDGIVNEFKHWTPLKLATLSYYVQQYLNIIRGLEENKGAVKIFYIDVFAGSGLNKIKDADLLFAGSPLVAIDCASEAKRQFDYILLNDLKYGHILKRRIEKLKDLDERYSWLDEVTIDVRSEDANDALEYFIEEYISRERYKNYLAFIDPYRSEISQKALEALLRIKYGDIFMTFQARSIAREIGGYNRGIKGEGIEKELTAFFGVRPEIWSKLNSEQKVLDFYVANIIGKYKPYSTIIKIKGGKSAKGFGYALIFATGKKNPGWEPFIENMKKIELFDGDIVEEACNVLTGKTKTITEYFQEDDEDKGLLRWFK